MFDILPEEYNPVRVSYNVNTAKVKLNDLKSKINWFWKTENNEKKHRKSLNQKKIL